MDNDGNQAPIGPDPNAIDRPAPSKLWMKDSSGFPSVTITFLTISFWITTLAYVASIVHQVGPFTFSSFDVGACGAYFGIIFSAYIARRYTDARWGNPNVAAASAANSTTVVVAPAAPAPAPTPIIVTPPAPAPAPPIPPAPVSPLQPPIPDQPTPDPGAATADPAADPPTVIQG